MILMPVTVLSKMPSYKFVCLFVCIIVRAKKNVAYQKLRTKTDLNLYFTSHFFSIVNVKVLLYKKNSGCRNPETGRRCIFPFVHDGRSVDRCISEGGRYGQYKCATLIHDGEEPDFEECNQLCPVECERGKTYKCNGECIPFNRPCNGECRGKGRFSIVSLG
jgi:hypothetical protein